MSQYGQSGILHFVQMGWASRMGVEQVSASTFLTLEMGKKNLRDSCS